MEGNLKIDISETNRGKEQIIIDRKFKYNFSKLKKDNTKIYRCTEYKTLNKCKSFIILNDNKEVLNYDSSHNHPGNEINASKSLIKHKIKDEIKKSLIPSDIKSKRIFDKISQEIGYICPEYKTIKSQITRYKNKQLFPNVKTFDEVPNVSEYYKTIRGEYFMIFKYSNIIIFQSPFQAKLFMENKHIFADGTFLIAPTNSYQVFITRTYVTELNCFYTTSMSILKNKEQTAYEILFNEIKKYIIKYNANINFSEKIFHCDFEKGISNAVENIFPNINIKYCFWHYKRLLMTKKNKLCYKEVKDHNILNTYYKAISNLCFINIEYIPDIFNKIKNTCMRYKSTCSQFLNFLDYFEKTFLNIYNIKYWNYYNNIDHITNNASESYNRIWRKKSRISERVDDINIFVEYYKNMEAELKNIGCSKNDIIENWFNCLIRLNNEIINFNKTK
ncbi:hypothetical protein H8356DRAFT_1436287 [Neocallimastix lanati (nom. inval.)]|nr:hypothetical protein H8356DRAFT_1436287 [Neocallimastix sp. JGI-2020a]